MSDGRDLKSTLRKGLNAQVLALADGTRTNREIADAIGATPAYVRATLRRLGLMAKVRRVPGRITVLLTDDLADWLIGTLPAGVKPADFVLSILYDAKARDQEG